MRSIFDLARIALICLAVLLAAPAVSSAQPTDETVDSLAEEAHEAGGEVPHGAEHGHETGPPLDPPVDLVIWSIVTFLIFLWVLKAIAWKPLVSGLNRREEGIRNAIAEAHTARREAQALLKEHEGRMQAVDEEVREIIAEARRDAERTKADIVAAAQAEAEATKNRAIAEITRAKEQALSELFATISTQVTEATEHVLGRAITPADRQRLIDEGLDQFSRRN